MLIHWQTKVELWRLWALALHRARQTFTIVTTLTRLWMTHCKFSIQWNHLYHCHSLSHISGIIIPLWHDNTLWLQAQCELVFLYYINLVLGSWAITLTICIELSPWSILHSMWGWWIRRYTCCFATLNLFKFISVWLLPHFIAPWTRLQCH